MKLSQYSTVNDNGSNFSNVEKFINVNGLHKKIEGNVQTFTKKISYVPQKVSIDWTLPIRVLDFMVLTEDLEPKLKRPQKIRFHFLISFSREFL